MSCRDRLGIVQSRYLCSKCILCLLLAVKSPTSQDSLAAKSSAQEGTRNWFSPNFSRYCACFFCVNMISCCFLTMVICNSSKYWPWSLLLLELSDPASFCGLNLILGMEMGLDAIAVCVGLATDSARSNVVLVVGLRPCPRNTYGLTLMSPFGSRTACSAGLKPLDFHAVGSGARLTGNDILLDIRTSSGIPPKLHIKINL